MLADWRKTGQLFYGLSITAYGLQQIIIRDFRPQIVAGFPAWAHGFALLPILSGALMGWAGCAVAGVLKTTTATKKQMALYLALYFFVLIVFSHIPYLLFVYPHKLSHLGSWGDLLKALAFCGASFVVAASFGEESIKWRLLIGKIFFCTTIILFGCNHFVYDLSAMVPRWLIWQHFWSNFGGAALLAAGIAILFNVLARPAALLLALMLLLWVFLVHLPGAIADPYEGRGNLIVSTFDALQFSGIALLIAFLK